MDISRGQHTDGDGPAGSCTTDKDASKNTQRRGLGQEAELNQPGTAKYIVQATLWTTTQAMPKVPGS